MQFYNYAEFKKQTSAVGIQLESSPLGIQSIQISSGSRESTSFTIPSKANEIPEFINLLIESSDYQNGLWLIQVGSWHDPCGLHLEHTDIHAFLLTKLGLLENQEGALYFEANDIKTLKSILLLNITLLVACTLTDIYLLSDTGSSIFKFSHHNSVRAEFKNSDRISKCMHAISHWTTNNKENGSD